MNVSAEWANSVRDFGARVFNSNRAALREGSIMPDDFCDLLLAECEREFRDLLRREMVRDILMPHLRQKACAVSPYYSFDMIRFYLFSRLWC